MQFLLERVSMNLNQKSKKSKSRRDKIKFPKNGKISDILAEENNDHLKKYAEAIGLAFQIKDDLLDHEGTTEKIGKKVGKDNQAGKATLVSILGEENAKKRCLELCEEACESLNLFGKKSEMLKIAARFTIERGF